MPRLITPSKTLAQNSLYVGLENELVIVTGVGVAIHDGINAGGKILTEQSAYSPNLLRNPHFKISQNGTSFQNKTGAGDYVIDGWWLCHNSGSSTNSASVPDDVNRGYVITVTSGGNDDSFTRFVQTYPHPQQYSGRKLTLSFDVKCSISTSIAVEGFIEGGGVFSTERVNVTGSFQRKSVTFNVPNYVEDDAELDKFQISFWLEAGDDWNSRTGGLQPFSGTFEFNNMKLEEGSVPTNCAFDLQDEENKVKYCFESDEQNDLPFFVPVVTSTANAGTIIYSTDKARAVAPVITSQFTNDITIANYSESRFIVTCTPSDANSGPRVLSYVCNAELTP